MDGRPTGWDRARNRGCSRSPLTARVSTFNPAARCTADDLVVATHTRSVTTLAIDATMAIVLTEQWVSPQPLRRFYAP